MERFISDIDGKILTDVDGRFFVPAKIPDLEFEIESTEFPPTGHSDRRLAFYTRSLPQRIFIDYGDGSPIYEGDFVTSNFNPLGGGGQPVTNADAVHTYADGSRKTVKIWFSHPEKISEIRIISPTKWNWVGEFPLNISLYDLDYIYLRNTKFDEFPLQLTGGVFRELRIDNITETPINFIPKWIYYSRITTLRLLGGFNLSDLSVSNFEKLVNVQGLERLYMGNIQANTANIPNTLKDIPTLRTLSFQNIPITEIPSQFNNCKQITELIIENNPNITSWGVGIANMPNLQVFRFDQCNNAPDTLPTGIETAPNCKTIWARTNRTQVRQDTFIENVYNQVTTTASMATGQGILRRTTLRLEKYGGGVFAQILRPSGIYQAPAGYVQGSSNGTPASPMEMIYVLVNQYEWTIYVTSEGTGHDIYAP